MSPQSPIVPFRANDEDRKRLEYLKGKLKKKTAPVIREAIERLFEAVKSQDK